MAGAGDKMEVEDLNTKLNEMQINDMHNHNEDVRKPIISAGLFTSKLFKVQLFNHIYQSQRMIYRFQGFSVNTVKKTLSDRNFALNTFQIVP